MLLSLMVVALKYNLHNLKAVVEMTALAVVMILVMTMKQKIIVQMIAVVGAVLLTVKKKTPGMVMPAVWM